MQKHIDLERIICQNGQNAGKSYADYLIFSGSVWFFVFHGGRFVVFRIGRSLVVRTTWCVLGVLGVSFVFHISDVSAVVVGLVGDDLGAAVGEESVVRAGNVTFAIAGLLVSIVVVGVVVLYSPGKVVGRWNLITLQKKIMIEYQIEINLPEKYLTS